MVASAARKAGPAPAAGFNLGDLSQYSSGGVIPEGDYCLEDFTVQMFQGTKQDGSSAGPARLGVMITLLPMAGGEKLNQFYSFGSKAHESWAPNAETGKGIVAVPGGPGTAPNASTNWAVFLKSLYDSGMPQGILTDDFSVVDGLWVHISNVPEPTERKGFVSKTGEAAVEDKARTIAVVTAILDGGAPWEGGGGVPATAKPATHAGSAQAPKTLQKAHNAAVAHTRAAAAPAPAPSDDIEVAAVNAVSSVLEKSPNGLKKLQLRTSTFKALGNPALGQQVMNTYFSSDEALNGLINGLGYKVAGIEIVAE